MKKYLLVINLPRVEELEVKQEGAAARASKIPDLTFWPNLGKKNDGDENSWQTIAFDRPLFLDEEKVYYSSWNLPIVRKRVNFCLQNKARILSAPFFAEIGLCRSAPENIRRHFVSFASPAFWRKIGSTRLSDQTEPKCSAQNFLARKFENSMTVRFGGNFDKNDDFAVGASQFFSKAD